MSSVIRTMKTSLACSPAHFSARPRHRQTGSLLIAAVVLIAIIGVLAATLSVLVGGSSHAALAHLRGAQALFIGEAGLEKGARGWIQNAAYPGESNTAFGTGDFTISVFNTDFSGAALPTNQKRIRSVGVARASGGVVAGSRTVETLIQRPAVWTAGNSGVILQWNGATWAASASGTASNLVGIFCSSVTNCWAVGASGTIRRWNGTSWAASVSGTGNTLNEVGCQPVAPFNCFAVGNSGTIRRWDGTSWAASASGTGNDLLGVHCPTTICYAVGQAGTILRYNGAAWAVEASGTTRDLRDVYCTSATACWAVGQRTAPNLLTFVQRTAAWAAALVVAPVYVHMNGVSCLSASDCWAVGAVSGGNYTMLHWNGASWSYQPLAGTVNLLSVSCDSGGTCWTVGNSGRTLRMSVSTWTPVASGVATNLLDVHIPLGAYGGTRIVAWQELMP